jgi:hypothetical protein
VTQEPGATFEATYESGETGLIAEGLAVAIHDQEGSTVAGPQTTDLTEIVVSGQPTGIYSAILVAPATEAQYSIVWSNDGSFEPTAGGGQEDLLVAASILGLSPLPPLTDYGSTTGPPCSAWTTRAAVAACCPGFADSTTDEQDAAIRAATEILYAVSNGLYPGECGPTTVRPCRQSCSCWGPWSAGYAYTWDASRARWGCDGRSCGCSPQSEVELAGVPIREIVEVLIDGEALLPEEYALREPNVLVRMRDPDEPRTRLVWPGCQIMDLDEDQPGTFAITYTWGADPPQAGRTAAAALACQVWAACSAGVDECDLPEGVTRLVRQNVTIEIAQMAAKELKNGATGIAAIDAFVAIFAGEDAVAMPTMVWSPDLPDFPQRFRPSGGT